MPQGDKVTKTGSQVSYLRGVLEGEKLSADERLELALSTFADMSEKLVEFLEEVRDEQREIRKLLSAARQAAAEEVEAPDARETIACPLCGQSLAVAAEPTTEGSIEVTCPACDVVIELMP